MKTRSQLMIRPKQQLQNQLLMNFRKKNKNQTIDLYQSQKFNKRYNTPNQNNVKNQNSFMCKQNNRSILDQFSKCPIREDQVMYNGEIFLNKFMYTKNKPVFPTSAKTSVSVQTQKNNQQKLQSEALLTKAKLSQQQQQTRTPPKVTDFNQKQQKSIIDVSANLSNFKFPISANKNAQISNRVLTDSILGAPQKQQKLSSQDSAEQLLKQLQSASSSSLSFNNVKKDKEAAVEKYEPIVKKIQLTTLRNKNDNQQSLRLNQSKQNSNYLINTIEIKDKNYISQDESDQKLQKLLSKKSLIKNMIVKKNENLTEKANKAQNDINKQKVVQKSLPQIDKYASNKWDKPSKKYTSEQLITQDQKPLTKKASKERKLIQQVDPLDLLSPYETSSSGLQAVIEQQNESEMQESLKNKNNLKVLPKQKNAQKKLFQSLQQPIKNSKKQEIPNKRQYLKSKKVYLSSQKSLKQISLGDLSLEDVSEIQKQSGNKKLPETFKKIYNTKDLNDQLPDYEDSDEDQKSIHQKITMHKYVVNDISKDIENLRKKISQDASLIIDQKPKENTLKVSKTQNIEQKPNKNKSQNGSEGPDKKITSMLDFFDQINQKLDFQQISKDILDLRDRIANDSQ